MRRTERVNVELSVVWHRAGRRLDCRVLDINAHGMFISTDQIIEHESLMHVCIKLPEHELPMFVTARYVGRTVKGHGIGVEIFLIDDVSRSRWLAFYEQQLAVFNARAAATSSVALSAGP
jgi:PilZ domain